MSNLIGFGGDCEVAIPFLFDVDTVVRRRMYGANQVIENQWGARSDRDDKRQVRSLLVSPSVRLKAEI